ncbi:MAG: hypoxanthine phosphoribosyltransferase [Desulfobacterales bacterium]
MPEFDLILSRDVIGQKVKEVAKAVSEDYKGRDLVIVGVLKGAFIFLSDLVREITIPLKVDFIGASSYGHRTESSGSVRITKDVDIDLSNKDVLIVEDIVDTGLTLAYLIEHIKSAGALSVKTCTLIDKHERRSAEVRVDYACHVAEKGFLVGYGLDYAEFYRNLPGIYHLKL